jgi:galactose mutarotase-like enzyme
MFHIARGERIQLQDDAAGSSVAIVPARGAIVTSFAVAGRELLYLDEATLRDPSKNVRGGVPLLFPSPGRLEGDRFAREGKSGAMKQHGFARDASWVVVSDRSSEAAEVSLALAASEDTLAHYPWTFRATYTVSLRGARLRLELAVHNTDTAPLPFAFGIHPYFAVAQAEKAGARIATGATRAFDNVKKEIVPFRGFDLASGEVDLHLLDHGSSRSELTWGDGRRLTLSASAEMTRWVVWTLPGKDFVCLEPWSAPGNALNTGEGLMHLAPGATHRSWIEMEAGSARAGS